MGYMKKSIKKPKTKRVDVARKGTKTQYKVTNWREYNKSLIERGSITLWISDDVLENWFGKKEGNVGRPKTYSDKTVELILTLGQLYQLPLRAVEGFVGSLCGLLGTLLTVPNYTTLSRRNQALKITLRKRAKEITDIIIDSTGLKVYGEGEWKARKHGVSKRRTWKKVHIGIDESGELRAVEVTDNDVHDSEAVPRLLGQEDARIDSFAGDGAYDTRGVYDTLMERAVKTYRIPPQKNAKIWQHGNSKQSPHPRDQNLRQIRETSRKQWKETIGYHKRSLSENTMFRLKTIFPPSLRFRVGRSQENEVMMRANILNTFFHLGMPQSVPVAVSSV
jgi:hypothetical protein